MTVKAKQSEDLSSIQCSDDFWLASDSDGEGERIAADCADLEEESDTEMTGALPPPPQPQAPPPQVSFDYLEPSKALRALFGVPEGLLIRSSYVKLYKIVMEAIDGGGKRHETLDRFCSLPACALLEETC